MSVSATQAVKMIDTQKRKQVQFFCQAARDNNTAVLEKTIDAVGVNTPYDQGATALHYACQAGAMKAVFFLINGGGNILQLNTKGRTPRSYLSPENIAKLEEFLKNREDDLDTGEANPAPANANTTNGAAGVINGANGASVKAKAEENGIGIRIEFNMQKEADPGGSAAAKPQPKPKEDDFPFSTVMGYAEDATLTLEGKIYHGSLYTLAVQNYPAGTRLVIEMSQHGLPEPGLLQIGVNLPNNPQILPLLRLHKTKNHDFYIKKGTLDHESTLQAELGVFRVNPAGYTGLDENNIIPRMRGIVRMGNSKDTKGWRKEMLSRGIERTHSPEPAEDGGVINDAPGGPKPLKPLKGGAKK
jgi:hypothetical protein